MSSFIILLITYITVGTLIALISRRYGVKSSREYFVANYRLGGFLSSMTYAATTYSAFMMVGLVGLTYSTGVGALGFELAYFIATLSLLTTFSRKVWLMARERGWVSPSEMLSDLYNSKLLGSLTAVIYFIALIPYISAQLIGVGAVFEGLGMGYLVGVVLGAVLLILWIVIAGIWSVATTDAYQGIWMIGASVLFLCYLISLVPTYGYGIKDVLKAVDSVGATGITPFWSPSTFLAYTLPWLFFAVTNPQVVQRLYMPADERAIKSLITYFSLYGLTYTLIVVTAGLIARSLTELGVVPLIINRDLVTPTLLKLADPISSAFIYVSIIAAALSTANSIILTVTSSIIRDFYESRVRSASPTKLLTATSITIITLTALSSIIAYLRPSFIVEMSVISSVILLPLAPITLIAWINHREARKLRYGAIASLIIGTSISMLAATSYGPAKSFLITFYGLPLSAWVLITSSLIMLVNYLTNAVSIKYVLGRCTICPER